jgi:TatD DNase family protein
VELAERYDSVYATAGVHPHDARTLDDAGLEEIRRLAAHPKVVAIGEIGLDYYRDLSPRPVQKAVFRRQLELAVELGMPIVIHTRESFEDTLRIVEDYSDRLVGAVFHCFPGDEEDARRVFDLGFIISVGGVITFPKSRMARVAAAVPLERLILETDAPYLTPVPYRGKLNKPAYVRIVYEKLAELRGEKVADVRRTVDRTARKFYRLVETFGD